MRAFKVVILFFIVWLIVACGGGDVKESSPAVTKSWKSKKTILENRAIIKKKLVKTENGYYIIWSELSSIIAKTGKVSKKFYDQNFNPVGTEIEIDSNLEIFIDNLTEGNKQFYFDSNTNGDIIIAWIKKLPGQNIFYLYLQFYDSRNSSWSDSLLIDNSTETLISPKVLIDSKHNIFTIWGSIKNLRLFLKYFDRLSNSWSAKSLVDENVDILQLNDIREYANNNILIYWMKREAFDNINIYSKFLNLSNNYESDNIKVNSSSFLNIYPYALRDKEILIWGNNALENILYSVFDNESKRWRENKTLVENITRLDSFKVYKVLKNKQQYTIFYSDNQDDKNLNLYLL